MAEGVRVAVTSFAGLVGLMALVAPCVVLVIALSSRMAAWPTWAAATALVVLELAYASLLVGVLTVAGVVS